MKDLTTGPIRGHVVALAVPMAAGMLLQTIYFFVDLYFVSRLGDAAIAGVSAAGNLMFVVFGVTQMLSVGTVALVSQAVGRKDREAANDVFNQSVGLGAVLALVTLAAGYAAAGPYMRLFGADAPTRAAGELFLRWLMPALALQYALAVMGSGLRATGIVNPTMVAQALTVVANAVLAPVFIAGWGTGKPLGVAGAALATLVGVALGVAVLAIYFVRLEHYVRIDRARLRPKLATWARIIDIGFPSGGEFAFLALFVAVMYWAIRDFGAAAQAGFGVGSRINQMIFVPAMAVAFAAAPIAGQNFGARKAERVRETFRTSAAYGAAIMVLLTAWVQWKAQWMARLFTDDPAVIAVCVEYLHYISWNFVGAGLTFTCSAIFQALGNTWPSLWASAMRLVIFALPGVWMAAQPWFELRYIFTLSVMTVLLQAAVNYFWLQAEMRKRLIG